jgi:hypothetical protein
MSRKHNQIFVETLDFINVAKIPVIDATRKQRQTFTNKTKTLGRRNSVPLCALMNMFGDMPTVFTIKLAGNITNSIKLYDRSNIFSGGLITQNI